VISAVLLLGVTYFWLHSLPERLGHKKLQFQIVAVLGLLSLFTHMHVFWIIGLLLAVIDLPDFIAPLHRIADSAEKIAGDSPQPVPAPASYEPEIQLSAIEPSPPADPPAPDSAPQPKA
jgi:hypothetical protein